jgi:preprotein translocase subunit SecY
MRKLIAVFSIPELRQKILITLGLLAVYRIGYFVPLPFIDQQKMLATMTSAQQTALGQALGMISILGGGNLSQFCIFSLGIMPYISASIIFQVLAYVYPPLEKLQKEGESGRKKLNEYTRYATVLICLIQAAMPVQWMMRSDPTGGGGMALPGFGGPIYWISAILTMTAGTIFLMWLGEQIDEYGIGNGISLIIMAGIVARIPDATMSLLVDTTKTWTFLGLTLPSLKPSVMTLGGGAGRDITLEKLIVLIALFLFVVVAVIFITMGQRRIPTQSAKHVRGRRVYGGTRQYLPLRLNQSGVMPIIFAGSLLMIPMLLFQAVHSWSGWAWAGWLQEGFNRQTGYLYNLSYIALIFFFCYFWTAMQFNPKKMADDLKDHGSFIPGYRPGRRTAEYLERVMMRITYVGAAFLAVVAVIPTVLAGELDINYRVASFYGGTGLLIVISVALDLVQKINGHLVMRNYAGLTED